MSKFVNRYFEGVLVGGLLGFVLGLLSARRSGAELRQELITSADSAFAQASKEWQVLKVRAEKDIEPWSHRMSKLKVELKKKAGCLTDRLKSNSAVLKDKAVMLREKLVTPGSSTSDVAASQTGQDNLPPERKCNHFQPAGNSSELLENYMGNKSGPVYMPDNNRL